MMNPDSLDWEPYDRHWIRLRGPWDVSWLRPPLPARERELGAPQRTRLPADWLTLFGKRTGTARFTRRFNRPTRLDEDELLVLTLTDVRASVAATLNATRLTPLDSPAGDPACAPPGELLSFDITKVVQVSNLLELDISVAAPVAEMHPQGLWKPVLLEIITSSDAK